MEHNGVAVGDGLINKSVDFISLVYIAFLTVLLIIRWHIFPVFIDIYYHLAVMQGYNLAGGITKNAYWEFAPFGRPQLYPPLLHLLMLILYKFHISLPFIAKFTSFIMFPLTLLTEWWIVKKIYNSKAALFSVVFLGSIYQFFWHSSVLSAAALTQILGLLAFLAIEKDKKLASSVLITLMLYSHIAIPYFYFTAFLLYGLLRKVKRKLTLSSLFISAILFSPWLVHLVSNLSFIHMRSSVGNGAVPLTIHLYLWIWLFGIAGIAAVIKKRKEFLFPLILLVVLIPIAFTYRQRFFEIHGLIPLSILAGIGVSSLLHFAKNKKNVLVLAILLAVLFGFTTPVVNITYRKVHFRWDQPLAFALIKNINPVSGGRKDNFPYKPAQRPDMKPPVLYPRKSIMTKSNIQLAHFISKTTKAGSTIYVPDGPLADFIFAFGKRPVSSGMLGEVKPYKRPFPQDCAYLLIPGNVLSVPPPMDETFNRVAFTNGFTIFENKRSVKKVFPEKPVFPNWLSFILIVISAIIITLDFMKKRRANGNI